MPIVPAFGRQRPEGQEFKVILSYTENSKSAYTTLYNTRLFLPGLLSLCLFSQLCVPWYRGTPYLATRLVMAALPVNEEMSLG